MKKFVSPGASMGWLASLLVFAVAAQADEFERRVSVEPGGTLSVHLDSGELEVEGHDEAEVRVDAEAGGDRMEFSLEKRGGDVELRGRQRGLLGWLGNRRVSVRVRVPRAFSLDLRTGGGEISVENLEGNVVARTSGGEVAAFDVRGSVELHTSGGEVRAEEISGDVFARTSGGPVHIREVGGRVDAQTSGGELELHDVGGPVRARTSGGPISVRFTRPPAGDLRTSGGGIELEFPEGAGLRLDARTSGGGIELGELELLGLQERDRARGDLNGGGELVELHTSGGTIRVQER